MEIESLMRKIVREELEKIASEKTEAEQEQRQEELSLDDSKVLMKVTYEIEEWLHDELKVKAVREKRKVSEIVNELIKNGLK